MNQCRTLYELPVSIIEFWIVTWDDDDISIPSVFGLLAGAIIWRWEILAPLDVFMPIWFLALFRCINPLNFRFWQLWKNKAYTFYQTTICLILVRLIECNVKWNIQWSSVLVHRSFKISWERLTVGLLYTLKFHHGAPWATILPLPPPEITRLFMPENSIHLLLSLVGHFQAATMFGAVIVPWNCQSKQYMEY